MHQKPLGGRAPLLGKTITVFVRSDILPRFHEILNESFSKNFNEIFMQAKFHEILNYITTGVHYICILYIVFWCIRYLKHQIKLHIGI